MWIKYIKNVFIQTYFILKQMLFFYNSTETWPQWTRKSSNYHILVICKQKCIVKLSFTIFLPQMKAIHESGDHCVLVHSNRLTHAMTYRPCAEKMVKHTHNFKWIIQRGQSDFSPCPSAPTHLTSLILPPSPIFSSFPLLSAQSIYSSCIFLASFLYYNKSIALLSSFSNFVYEVLRVVRVSNRQQCCYRACSCCWDCRFR